MNKIEEEVVFSASFFRSSKTISADTRWRIKLKKLDESLLIIAVHCTVAPHACSWSI